jgi:hypothetical protein
MFRNLSDAEVREFRQWARDNYRLYSEIRLLWHPVVQRECEQMNREDVERRAQSWPDGWL